MLADANTASTALLHQRERAAYARKGLAKKHCTGVPRTIAHTYMPPAPRSNEALAKRARKSHASKQEGASNCLRPIAFVLVDRKYIWVH
jgi:hypothetical protein